MSSFDDIETMQIKTEIEHFAVLILIFIIIMLVLI